MLMTVEQSTNVTETSCCSASPAERAKRNFVGDSIRGALALAADATFLAVDAAAPVSADAATSAGARATATIYPLVVLDDTRIGPPVCILSVRNPVGFVLSSHRLVVPVNPCHHHSFRSAGTEFRRPVGFDDFDQPNSPLASFLAISRDTCHFCKYCQRLSRGILHRLGVELVHNEQMTLLGSEAIRVGQPRRINWKSMQLPPEVSARTVTLAT
jgi:hypothetical protein